jgi:hypothetical protein
MKNKNQLYLFIALLATVVMGWWLRVQGHELVIKGQTPMGIVDLEFAWNKDKVLEVLGYWSGGLVPIAEKNIYWDFLFIIAYSAFLSLACRQLAQRSSGWWARSGEKLSRMALAAGTFDVAENALMLLSIHGEPNNYTAAITATFAGFKFLLIILIILYLVAGRLALVFKKAGQAR